jgi:hypothetical protein
MAVASAISQSTPYGDIDAGIKFDYVFGTITLSGSYATGGDTWDLTAMTKPVNHFGLPPGSSAVPPLPLQVYVQGRLGYVFVYVPGTTRANGKLKILASVNTEVAASAYSGLPGNLATDVIQFQLVLPKF